MQLKQFGTFIVFATTVLILCLFFQAQHHNTDKLKIIIDQDASGPAGSDLQAILLLIQAPQTQVLGITISTGDAWLTEEVAHTLRMLELIKRTDIPVIPGAEYPLIRTKKQTEQWERQYGSVVWKGAWTPEYDHPPRELGAMPEGKPTIQAANEDAAHFMVRMVRKHPHEVTIYEGGPMTNLARAIELDPDFPRLAKQLVFMGGSLNPKTDNPEFANNPKHEFNLWFDPEAAHIVLQAPWKKIICTTVDVSLKTQLSRALIDKIKANADHSSVAKYVVDYTQLSGPYNYLWDELAAAAWLDPTLITKKENRYMDVDLSPGAGYGNTLTWSEQSKPKHNTRLVEIQLDVDTERFYALFVALLSAPSSQT